jgi:DNA-binding winged helix-turn-helix (wHTH) protein
MLVVTPGTLSGSNILTDADERTWLTDFADAGYAPLLWNYVALEAAIRFDWVETRELQWLHEMEQRLTSSVPGAFRSPDSRDLEPVVREPVRAIEVIRRLTSRTVGQDPLPYHLGMMFHAARRVAALDPKSPLMPNELAHLAHALIAAAMICKMITEAKQGAAESASPVAMGLRVDKANHEVWVEGRRIPLRGQGYDLLLYLYEHANQLCTRRELVEQVFGDKKYDEGDKSQRTRLNTAIRRLREKVEHDPDNPRYLLSEPGAGYRLVPHPEE